MPGQPNAADPAANKRDSSGTNLELVGIGLVVAGAAGGGLRLAGVVELDSVGTTVAAALVVLGGVVLWYRTEWEPAGIGIFAAIALSAVLASAVFGSPEPSPGTTPLTTATTTGTTATPSITTPTTSVTLETSGTTEATTPPPIVPHDILAADALAQLRADGACLVVSYFPTFSARDADVLSTDPAAGSMYAPGDTVRVVVASNPPSQTVLSIRDRGVFRASFTGLIGEQHPDGSLTGFEPDLARELVARVFGEGFDIEFSQLTAQERFVAISSGSVDVLFGVIGSGESASPTRFYDDDSTRQVAIVGGDEQWLNEFDRNLAEVLSDTPCRR